MYNEIQLKKIFRGLQGPEFSVTIQEVQEETSFKEHKRWFPKIWKGLVQRVEEGREGPFALELNTKKPFGYFQWHVCAKKQQDGTGTDWDPHVSNVWATLRITPDCLVSCRGYQSCRDPPRHSLKPVLPLPAHHLHSPHHSAQQHLQNPGWATRRLLFTADE